MNKRLKFNNPKLNSKQIWVGSDFHFHHDKDFIFVPRGFSNVAEHDNWILNDINTLIKQDDILFFLGDGMLNARNDHDFEQWFNRIICQNIYYVWGNHEGPSYAFYKRKLVEKFGKDAEDFEVYPFKINNITFVGNYLEAEVLHQVATMTHFPFSLWNKSHRGTINLSGHSHSNNLATQPSTKLGKVLDCGVDICQKYWSHAVLPWDMVLQIMAKKETPVIDHHVASI
jgi:calcineurin-like phosphoesterase family protein